MTTKLSMQNKAQASKKHLPTDLLVVVTARCGSERCPDKMMAEVQGYPLIYWVLKRYQRMNCNLVFATTTNKDDDCLVHIADLMDVSVTRFHNPNDVVSRIERARQEYYPEAKLIFRALGDCPFYATELLEHASEIMLHSQADAFSWMLPPENLPIYGAREFPYSAKAWELINSRSEEREHADWYFTQHRSEFRIAYHEPPPNDYLRPPTYRLEVDYVQDIEFVKAVADGVGMSASLRTVIQFLDEHPDVVAINSHCQEKTGPLTSFTHQERRAWFGQMRGQPVIDWDGRVWKPKSEKGLPVFCGAGSCLIGYGESGRLYTLDGHQLGGPDLVTCKCGVGRVWHAPIEKRKN